MQRERDSERPREPGAVLPRAAHHRVSVLHELSLVEAAARVRRREISAVELTRAALARIAAVEPKVGAFLTLADVEAIAAAEAIDRRIAAGHDPGLLGGVPVGVKDIICTAGLRTTAASRILERFVPAYDATVTARLRAGDVFAILRFLCCAIPRLLA